MKYTLLSETELDILQLLWRQGCALSRPEILEGLQNKEWNPNSIHQVLNSMMKKGVLEVEGLVRCGKIYGRTYGPSITRQQFLARRVREITPDLTTGKRLMGVISALTEQDGMDAETIHELEELIESRKQELNLQ